MKTTKFAIIAILIAFSTVCLASTDGFTEKPKKVIYTTLVKVSHNPGLLAAIMVQVDPGFLNNNQLTYTVDVVYQGILYKITGTELQWRALFNPKWIIEKEIKPVFTTPKS